jgi:hypothetical protein
MTSTRSRRICCAAAQLVVLVAAVDPALARMVGIVGYSGKSGGLFCGNAGFGCHAMGTGTVPPLVRFEGPVQVDPGAEVTYRFVVTSQAPEVQIQAGFNVAASAGELQVVSGQQEKLARPPGNQPPELTHTGPKDIDQNNEASWEFIWLAPTTVGEYVLFGSGNSVDASTTIDGDAAALTTLMIAVGDVPPTATPTVTPEATPCPGDCNGDGDVSIGELISGVNIALGTAAVDTCRACDADGNGAVSIGELIAAVTRALNGC